MIVANDLIQTLPFGEELRNWQLKQSQHDSVFDYNNNMSEKEGRSDKIEFGPDIR